MFCEQLLELHRGQGMDIYWRDNFHCPTEDEYRQMTIRSEYWVVGTVVMMSLGRCDVMELVRRVVGGEPLVFYCRLCMNRSRYSLFTATLFLRWQAYFIPRHCFQL